MGGISYINYHVLLVYQKSIGGEDNFHCTEMPCMIFLQVYEVNLIICVAKVGTFVHVVINNVYLYDM